ncbi:MAG: hypothetical protein ABJF88_09825 [Rhodothermales bacterium]
MRSYPVTGLLVLILFMSGCVTTKIQSQRDASFSEEIQRVYVYSSVRMDEEELAEAFSQAIESKFGMRGVAVMGRVKDPLALETDDMITEDVIAFAPTVVLVLTQTEASTVRTTQGAGMGFTQSEAAVYDASLYHPETKKRVWRAMISTSRDSFMTSQDAAAEKIAEKIVNKLIEDGLLG